MSQNELFIRLYSRGLYLVWKSTKEIAVSYIKTRNGKDGGRIKMFRKRCLIQSDSLEFVLKIKTILRSRQISYEERIKIWEIAGQIRCYSIYINKNDMKQAEELVREIKRGMWIRNVRKLSFSPLNLKGLSEK